MPTHGAQIMICDGGVKGLQRLEAKFGTFSSYLFFIFICFKKKVSTTRALQGRPTAWNYSSGNTGQIIALPRLLYKIVVSVKRRI